MRRALRREWAKGAERVAMAGAVQDRAAGLAGGLWALSLAGSDLEADGAAGPQLQRLVGPARVRHCAAGRLRDLPTRARYEVSGNDVAYGGTSRRNTTRSLLPKPSSRTPRCVSCVPARVSIPQCKY